MPIEKCIGRIVDVIYQDSKGNITKRQIRVYSVHDGRVRAFDTSKQLFRSLIVDRILAVQLVSRRAS